MAVRLIEALPNGMSGLEFRFSRLFSVLCKPVKGKMQSWLSTGRTQKSLLQDIGLSNMPKHLRNLWGEEDLGGCHLPGCL